MQAKNKKIIMSKDYTESAVLSEWFALEFVTLVPKPGSYSENEVMWTVLWLTSSSGKPAGSATSGCNRSAETGDDVLCKKKKKKTLALLKSFITPLSSPVTTVISTLILKRHSRMLPRCL